MRGYTNKKILNDFDGGTFKDAAVLGATGTVEVIRSIPGTVLSSGSTATAFALEGGAGYVSRALDAYFAPYPAYTIPSPGRENRVRNGNPITDARLKDGTYRVYGGDGTFLCLSEAKGGTLTAVKNFFGT